jgi:hypothetical protein
MVRSARVVAERGRLRGGAAPADLCGREGEKSGEGVQRRRQPAPLRAGPLLAGPGVWAAGVVERARVGVARWHYSPGSGSARP